MIPETIIGSAIRSAHIIVDLDRIPRARKLPEEREGGFRPIFVDGEICDLATLAAQATWLGWESCLHREEFDHSVALLDPERSHRAQRRFSPSQTPRQLTLLWNRRFGLLPANKERALQVQSCVSFCSLAQAAGSSKCKGDKWILCEIPHGALLIDEHREFSETLV